MKEKREPGLPGARLPKLGDASVGQAIPHIGDASRPAAAVNFVPLAHRTGAPFEVEFDTSATLQLCVNVADGTAHIFRSGGSVALFFLLGRIHGVA